MKAKIYYEIFYLYESDSKYIEYFDLGLDMGVPFIRRLRVESNGTTLEDINEYGKLYAQLFACQASQGAVQDATLTTGGIEGNNTALTDAALFTQQPAYAGAATAITAAESAAFAGDQAGANGVAAKISAAIDAATADVRTAVNNNLTDIRNKVNARTIANAGSHRANTQLADGNSVYFNLPIVSALFNMSKYLPLIMMNQGLILEIEFDVGATAGAFSGALGADVFQIDEVRYCAHLINLQRDFYDKLRLVMEGSGGVLQLAGTTYRHFGSSITNSESDNIPLPAKVKSIKGILFTNSISADKTDRARFGVSNSLPMGISEYQLRVGSVTYPPTSVKLNQGAAHNYLNKGEAYQELRKLFGTLGDYTHGGVLLNEATYLTATNTANAQTGGGTNVTALLNPFGLALDSFPKTALESGINSADRNLSMSLELKRVAGEFPVGTSQVDIWCMCDAI
eukprot:SAG11_NODE_207_length_12378_cov_8.404105_11_plen_454_part_01